MNIANRIARRYTLSRAFLVVLLTLPLWPLMFLFRCWWPSWLRFNAIHIITSIATVGIAVGAAALLLVLSVFNGFEELFMGMFSKFNPDIKVTPIEGKYFPSDTLILKKISQVPGVAHVSESLEEVAFFEYAGIQDFGIVKGVDAQFIYINRLDTTVHEGKFEVLTADRDMAVLGAGMRGKLSVNLDNFYTPVSVYMPKRNDQLSPLDAPFRKQFLYPAGVFSLRQDAENQYIITNTGFVESLLDRPGERSAIEIALKPDTNTASVTQQVQAIVGKGFRVEDRYRQDAAFLRLMNIEKWMSFAILSLTLVLVAFNMVGCMWMIVLDKKRDIAILRSMGATAQHIRRIFLYTGMWLSLLGLLIGLCLASLLFYLQKYHGLISVPVGFVIDSYPVAIKWTDFIVVTATVLGIGWLASLPAARRSMRVGMLIREE